MSVYLVKSIGVYLIGFWNKKIVLKSSFSAINKPSLLSAVPSGYFGQTVPLISE
jgi:hypothetical protein